MNKRKLLRALRTAMVAVNQAQLTVSEHDRIRDARSSLLDAMITYMYQLNNTRQQSVNGFDAVRITD
jgi:hypothetical protein